MTTGRPPRSSGVKPRALLDIPDRWNETPPATSASTCSRRLPVPIPCPLSSVAGEEADRVAGEEEVHAVTRVERRPCDEQSERRPGRILRSGRDMDQQLTHARTQRSARRA